MDVLVLAACPYPAPQGSQTFIAQSARALHRRGHRTRVLAYGHGAGPPLDDGIELLRASRLAGFRGTAAGPSWGRVLQDGLLAVRLDRLLRESPPDVILAHNHEAGVIAATVTRRRCRVAYYAHTSLGHELPTFAPVARPWVARFGRAVDRWLPRRVDLTVAVCDWLERDALGHGVDPGRVVRVEPGVDLSEWETDDSPPRRLDRPEAIYTGTLDAFQNVDGLLTALRTASARFPAARLTLASGSPPEPLLRAARRQQLDHHLRFVPAAPFPAVRRELEQAPVAILPRLQPSGYPIKLLNYMAAGTAVVAAAPSAKGLRHLETGLVVDPPTGEAMGEALVRLWSDPELTARLGRTARAEVLAERHLERFGRQLEGALERLRRP